MTEPDRLVRVGDLVGAADIARRLGYAQRETMHKLARRPGFPQPVAQVGGAKVWSWPDVAAWAEANGRPVAP